MPPEPAEDETAASHAQLSHSLVAFVVFCDQRFQTSNNQHFKTKLHLKQQKCENIRRKKKLYFRNIKPFFDSEHFFLTYSQDGCLGRVHLFELVTYFSGSTRRCSVWLLHRVVKPCVLSLCKFRDLIIHIAALLLAFRMYTHGHAYHGLFCVSFSTVIWNNLKGVFHFNLKC